jgi:hypothetical protein
MGALFPQERQRSCQTRRVCTKPVIPFWVREMDEVMTFEFSLHPPTGIAPSALDVVEGMAHDFETLVMEACEQLAQTDSSFCIGGFGTKDWHFDVGYDFSAMLEQLPVLLECIRSGVRGEIDFYSQGVERTLTFLPSGKLVQVECLSRTSWTPVPNVEFCVRGDLEAMIIRVMMQFQESLRIIKSPLADVEPFSSWHGLGSN